jgi:ribosomal protein L32
MREITLELQERLGKVEDEIVELKEWKRRTHDDPYADKATQCRTCGRTFRRDEITKTGTAYMKEKDGAIVSECFYMCYSCFASLTQLSTYSGG